MGDGNPICTLGDYSKPSHEGYRNSIELLVGNNVVPLRSDTIRLVQNECSFRGLRSEDPNQHLKDLLKLVDSLDLKDVPSTSDRRLIKSENQVQCLMEAYLAPTQPTQVNKITTSCEIYSGPHDTQYCMENPEQAFVDYASSRTDEAGEDDGEVMFIEIIRDDDESQNEGPNKGEGATTEGTTVEYFDMFPTRDELVPYVRPDPLSISMEPHHYRRMPIEPQDTMQH
ncbi:hypothetical protein Tco_1171712 [Tanacetum coccineum]